MNPVSTEEYKIDGMPRHKFQMIAEFNVLCNKWKLIAIAVKGG